MARQRITIVTGGASGIGEAAARRLAGAGDAVFICDIDGARGRGVADDICTDGGIARYFELDVCDDDQVRALAERIAAEHGAIDVLINSAGVLQDAASALDVPLGETERIMRVNYLGTVSCCRHFARHMKDAGAGAIIMLASLTSFRCSAQSAYGASKAAIVNLTECLAAELGPHGIRVNAVAPGYTLTPAMRAAIEAGARDPDRVIAASALRRFVTPADVADAIAFLCSQQASAITGITLPIDAGFLVRSACDAFAAKIPE